MNDLPPKTEKIEIIATYINPEVIKIVKMPSYLSHKVNKQLAKENRTFDEFIATLCENYLNIIDKQEELSQCYIDYVEMQLSAYTLSKEFYCDSDDEDIFDLSETK